MKNLTIISFILVIVGALNWLLVGLFNFNLVHAIFEFAPLLENIVYVVVGIAGVYLATQYKKIVF